MAGFIKGITIEFGADTTKLNSALKKTQGTINKTQTYAWEWIEKGKIRWRELESHPLFVPVNGGSVVSAKVV